MGSKQDVSICRTGSQQVTISGDIVVNGKSVSLYMDQTESLKKIVTQLQKQLAGLLAGHVL